MRSSVDDSLLEQMTQSLLEISSTFLVQQNELAEVKERLNRETLRVGQIQETLTLAAQKHQDAVLAVIQNYENLATELPPVAPPIGRSSSLPQSAAPPSLRGSASSSIDSSSGAAPTQEFLTVAQVHMPPAATQASIFRQAPKLADEDEEGGIDYVANLQVSGGVPAVSWGLAASHSALHRATHGTLHRASHRGPTCR